jgi:hypothetical protein
VDPEHPRHDPAPEPVRIMIRQAHYTSVAHGPRGMSGFQFCATSDDLDDRILRAVERLTTYQRPRDVGVDADVSAFPVNLVYTQLDPTDLKLISRVQFTGEDFSRRSGNYFAHSLIVDAVPGDLESPFPAELWDAAFWQSEPGPSEHLPFLPSPAANDRDVRKQLHSALEQAGGYDERLAWLIAAADSAVRGGRQVLLVGPTDEIVWQWIMATSYLLGPRIAPRLSFCTYGHDPARAGTHLIGLVSSRQVTQARSAGFSVLDVATGESPDAPSTDDRTLACAAMLTRAGIIMAGRAWRAAIAMGRPRFDQLAHWYPAVASALVSIGTDLSAGDLTVAIEWLERAQLDRHQHASIVEGFARQRLDELGAPQQAQLVEDALGLDAELALERGDLAGAIEQSMVDKTLRRLSAGSQANVIRLRTRAGTENAATECSRILKGSSSVGYRLAVLRWAAQAGVGLPDELVSAVGYDVMGLSLVDEGWKASRLTDVSREWSAFRAGLLSRLESEADALVDLASEYFRADIFEPSDFALQPSLGDRWVAERAAARGASPVEKFIETCEVRCVAGKPGLADATLLQRLWPAGQWTTAEAIAVAGAFPADEVLQSPTATFMAQAFLCGPGAVRAEREHWARLAAYLASWPAEARHEHGVEAAADVRKVHDTIETIMHGPPDTQRMLLIGKLVDYYLAAPPEVQEYLTAEIPGLILVHHSSPYLVLRGCPAPVLQAFCKLSHDQLLANPHNTYLAARLFVTRCDLRQHQEPRTALVIEATVLAPMVSIWTRQDVNAIGRYTEDIGQWGAEFTRWLRKQKRQRRARQGKVRGDS